VAADLRVGGTDVACLDVVRLGLDGVVFGAVGVVSFMIDDRSEYSVIVESDDGTSGFLTDLIRPDLGLERLAGVISGSATRVRFGVESGVAASSAALRLRRPGKYPVRLDRISRQGDGRAGREGSISAATAWAGAAGAADGLSWPDSCGGDWAATTTAVAGGSGEVVGADGKVVPFSCR
jgi:hypothetical protein